MNKSHKIFFALCVLLLGIFSGNYFTIKIIYLVGFTAVLLPVIICLKKKLRLVLVLMFIIGIWRFQTALPDMNKNHIAYYVDQKIHFEAMIDSIDMRSDHVKLVATANILHNKTDTTQINGKILIKTLLYPSYDYGDKIAVDCKITKPEPIEDFQYDRYLARQNIFATCYNPKIDVIAKSQGNIMIEKLLTLKQILQTTINLTIPEPQAAFLSGILIGSRTGIPQNLLDKFNTTGITHIIAISGYNISIIANILMNLTMAAYIPRKKAFWLILAVISCFAVITGMSAAVVRASIMGVLVLYVKYLGRKSSTANILIYSATLMCLVNPRILRDDAGFQLSFLATIGLIYFSPLLKPAFKWVPTKFGLQENLTTTLSAIILTLPLILYQFGRLSIVAPIVNILVLPLIPIIMFVGFIQVAVGLVSPLVGQAVGHIAWLLMEYIIQIVNIFSAFKWASINISFNIFFMLSSYGVIFYTLKKFHSLTMKS